MIRGMHGTKELPVNTQDEFDPIAYIERGFTDEKREPLKESKDELDVEIPSIGEFLGRSEAKPTKAVTPSKKRESRPKLSAPRPRRVAKKSSKSAIDPEIKELWATLPRNIDFLVKFFDDSVTANYYTGEFKESRDELIRRLLDPELTLEEVSRLLGVCPATVRRYTNRGWLAHHRTQGGQRRFRLTGVVRFIEEHGRLPQE